MSQKRKDTYYNKNLLDAQKEFEEKRHDRNIVSSFYFL